MKSPKAAPAENYNRTAIRNTLFNVISKVRIISVDYRKIRLKLNYF